MAAVAASPTMVGAITTLIVVVAVFLAYNANNGLPFVPVYRVSVVVPNAARLTPNNEVRIGGSRVGVIESIDAVRLSDDGDGPETTPVPTTGNTDGVVAQLNLKIDESASPIPVNSIFRIRYRSAFGLKYLDITRGDGPEAPQGFTFNGTNDNDDPADDDNEILSIDEVAKNQGADDGTFIAQTEFDEIGNTFDQATRNAIRQNLVGYGGGFTGRGASLNQAFEALNPLLTNLLPVAQTLNDRRTNLAGFFPALARTAAIVAPVAEQNAELFGNAATTLAAIGADPTALQATISGGPPALQTGIDVLPGQRPFLRDTAELASRLRPGVQATAARAAEPQRRDQGRDAGARPQRRHEPAAEGRLHAARGPGRAAGDEELAGPASGPVRQRQAARQVRRAGADRLQLLELPLDAAARAPDREGLDRILAARVAGR